MAEKTTYSCDVCGIEKKDSNHWWKAIECDGGLKFFRWNYKISDATPVIHLCGPGCASVKLSKFMGAVPAASTDPIAAMAALPIYPLPPQESGSQRPKEFEELDGKVAAHWREMETENQQPQWTPGFRGSGENE